MSESSGSAPPSPGSSAPPDPAGAHLSADQLAREHPLWLRSRGGGAPPPPPSDDGPRYVSLSMAAIERDHRALEDGEESDPGDPVDEEPEPEEEPQAEVVEDAEEARARMVADALRTAQFGVPFRSAASSAGSTTSSRRAETARKAAHAVPGITCVGCQIPHKMGILDEFVRRHFSSMTEQALWRHAALFWKTKVCEPARKEGVVVPPFAWRDISAHYQLHQSGNFLSRRRLVSQLQQLRAQLETRLVRLDGENREVDKHTAELLLKCVAAESKERALLDAHEKQPAKRRD